MALGSRSSLKKYVLTGLFAIAAAGTGLHLANASPGSGKEQGSSQDSAQEAPEEPSEDEIVGLTPAQIACLKGNHTAEQCTHSEELPPPDNSFPIFRIHRSELDQKLENILEDVKRDQLKTNLDLMTKPLSALIGLRVGGNRIFDHEIMEDPEKVATNEALGGPALWVKHKLEIRPEFNKQHSVFKINQSKLSGDFSIKGMYNNYYVIRFVKRHPLSRSYGENFWEYSKQELSILKQSTPMYFKYPFKHNIREFLPGEEIEKERFHSLRLFMGARAALIGLEAGILSAGLKVGLGMRPYRILGHFRTTVKVKRDRKVQVILDHTKSHSNVNFYATLDLDANLGPIDASETFGRAGWAAVETQETLLDMTFDLDSPDAEKALKAAYGGNFRPAQELAARPGTGVVKNADFFLDENKSERQIRLVSIGKRSAYANSTEKTTFYAEDGGQRIVDERTQEMSKHADGPFLKRDLKVTVRTDIDNPDPMVNRGFTVEYNFRDKRTNAQELLDALKVAMSLAPDEKVPEILAVMQKVQDKNVYSRAHFYIDFDPQSLPPLLNGAPGKVGKYWVAWAIAMGLEHPESWEGLSNHDRRGRAESLGIRAHFDAATSFQRAMYIGLKRKSIAAQVESFLRALRNVNFDPFPIAALAIMAEKSNIMSNVLLTVQDGKDASTVDFLRKGEKYTPPPKGYRREMSF